MLGGRSDTVGSPLLGTVKSTIDATARLASHASAILLICEILLLSAAVVFRYVLRTPLIWSDELAELLLIWQAMLGSVVAFHLGQHLRLEVLYETLSSRGRGILDVLCLVLMILICAPLAFYAFEDVLLNSDLVTPALGISPSWRIGALFVGLALITVLAAGQLTIKVAEGNARTFVAVLAAVAMTVLAAFLLRDVFAGLGNINLIIFFIGLGGACILIGLPIAFCFGIAAMAYVIFGTYAPLSIVPARMETGMAHILLLSVPLFIALGSMLVISGMADNMVKLLVSLVGHVRGGLSYVLVGGIALVSGISGSKAADMAAVAPVLVPEMRKRGAKDGEIVGLMAASCAMSETIPPSLILIMTGAVTGMSIGALFNVGWYPALVLAAVLCVMSYWRAAKSGESRSEKASWGTQAQARGGRAARADPAVHHPDRGRGGRRHGNRGGHRGHRLYPRARADHRAALRLVALLLVLPGCLGAHRRDLHHPGDGERHGVGLRAVGLFVCPGRRRRKLAGRRLRLLRAFHHCVHGPGKHPRRNPCDRAAGAVAFPGGALSRHIRDPLRARRCAGDGRRLVRAALRRRVLHRLRDMPGPADGRDESDMAICRRAVLRHRPGCGRSCSAGLGRRPVMTARAGDAARSLEKVS